MKNLLDFALEDKYAKVLSLKSHLQDMDSLLDWNAFLALFPDKETSRGRPEYDRVLMIKLLFLQSWHGLSDQELEYQVADRLSFQRFLGYPDRIPDYSTIWRFRDELTTSDLADKIWEELQNQLSSKNIRVEKGYIQDATFVHADPGKTKSGMNGRGREAKTSRSKDGSWTKKNGKSHFGFKSHVKVQRGSKLICSLAVTTARVHDNAIDLFEPDEIGYRDKAYTGVPSKAQGNGSMKRGNLTPHEELRNKRISRKRCQGEHPFGTMSRSMKAGHTRLTTIPRVFVQQLFVCAAYNLLRLKYIMTLA